MEENDFCSEVSGRNNTPLLNKKNKKSDETGLVRFAWLPMPLFWLLIACLWQANHEFVFEPPFLLPLLNFTLSTTVTIFVAYLAAASFCRNALFPVLLLGCGMLFSGTASLIGAFAVYLQQMNFGLTVYSTGMCLAGACHMMAAAASISNNPRIPHHVLWVLGGAYASVIVLTVFLARGAFEGQLPAFFVQGDGTTVMRQSVLGTAVCLFGIAGFLFALVSRKYYWQFGRWYALSLGLIATGLFGVLIEKSMGSPLGWAGWSAQYLGGMYMFGAVLVATQESGRWDAAFQEAFQEHEDRYRILAEASFEGIVISENGVIIDANTQLYRILGYENNELIGMRLIDLVSAVDRDRIIQSTATGRERTEEHRMIRKDGRLITVESHGRNISHPDKQIRYSAIRDITERRYIEQALRRSDERLRMAADAAEVGMWYSDLADNRLDINEQTYRLFGLPSDCGLDLKQMQAFVHAEDMPAVRKAISDSLSRGGPQELQYRIMRADGRIRWLHAKGVTYLDENGAPVRNIGIIMDITDRKEAEDALRESEAQFRTVVENSRDGIHLFDLRKRCYVFMSPAQEKLTGFSCEELKMSMEAAYERLHPEDREAVDRYLKRLLAGEEMTEPVEYRWCIKSGEYRWFSDIRSVICDDSGQPVCLVGSIRDITEQKRTAEKLRRAREGLELRVEQRTAELRRRAEQLARLSSELTMSEQRERRRLAQVLHDHLQQLLAGAKLQLENLVLDIPESQKEDARKIVHLLCESIRASRSLTMELSPPVLQKEGLAAAFRWLGEWMENTHGLTVGVRADTRAEIKREDLRILIFQSVRELLFNIAKHSGVNVAHIELTSGDDDCLLVTVRDYGKGFDISRMQDREGHPGGFGLFSIQERMTLIGGRLDVVSEIGSGTRFTIVVPREAEQACA